MNWIVSSCDLADHPKTLDLMTYTGYDIDTVLGKLHRFWYWVLRYADNGDLRKFNQEQLGRAVGLSGKKAQVWVDGLIRSHWIDTRPYLRVHDWWDYAGRYLQGRYGRRPEIWQHIQSLYCVKHEPKSEAPAEVPAQEPQAPPEKPKKMPKFTDSQLALAGLLRDKIVANNPKARIPDFQLGSWADAVRLMVEQDKRTEAEIKAVVEWSQRDSFWKMNILSMTKLRDKFDQLWVKMKGVENGTSGEGFKQAAQQRKAERVGAIAWKKPGTSD